jgi:radical SAM protein (TIGR01212 family)
LREVYAELLALPDAVAVHIATRADCLEPDVLALLREVSEQIDLTVELGLQSIHDATARRINRGHTYADFCAGYTALRAAAPRARISVHLINGLPGENANMMHESAAAVAALGVDEVKLHLLHVLAGTPLAALYERGEYVPLSMKEYVTILVSQLELFPPETVIGRVTGDGDPATLLAPLWSLKKFTVINAIDREMREKNTFQGAKY